MVTLPCSIHFSRTTWILVQKCFQVSFYLWWGNVWLRLSRSWLQWLSTIKKFPGKLSMLLGLQSLDWLTFKSFSGVRGQAGILRSLLMIHFSYTLSIYCNNHHDVQIPCSLLWTRPVTLLGLIQTKDKHHVWTFHFITYPLIIPTNLRIYYNWVCFYSFWLMWDYNHSFLLQHNIMIHHPTKTTPKKLTKKSQWWLHPTIICEVIVHILKQKTQQVWPTLPDGLWDCTDILDNTSCPIVSDTYEEQWLFMWYL